MGLRLFKPGNANPREWLERRARPAYLCRLLMPVPVLYILFALFWGSQFQLQADFTAFYTAASMVVRGMGSQLYDLELQRQVQQEIIFPHQFAVAGLLPFRNPPYAVLPLLPLALVPIGLAYWLWAAGNAAMFVAALSLLTRGAPGLRTRRSLRRLLWTASLAFLPFLSAVILGQMSFLILLFFVGGFYCLQRGRDSRAGFLLAGLLLKPQLALAVPLLLVLRGRWRALGGFAAGAAALVGASLLAVGPVDLLRFLQTSEETATWLPWSLDLTWAGFASGLLAGWPAAILPVTTMLDGVTLLLLWGAWRGPWDAGNPLFSLKLALLMLASMMVSPHLYGHDLILLVPVAFYVADYLMGAKVGARGARVAKLMGAVVFVTAFADSYPLLTLPVRPVFLAIVVTWVAVLMAVRRAEAAVDGVAPASSLTGGRPAGDR